MNRRLIDILVCPSCKGNLQLIVFENKAAEQIDVAVQMKQEVLSGLIKCACGNLYPVVEGVPSFVDGSLGQSSEFIQQHRQKFGGGK